MDRTSDHAVVLGASMGGLLAARVLSDVYQRVTIVERDSLPTTAENRRGVPQGRHVHALLASGAKVLDEQFPGLLADMVGGGAPVMTRYSELFGSFGGYRTLHEPEPMPVPVYQASRPYLESAVRARVRALPNVEIRERRAAVRLTTTATRDRVTGVETASLNGAGPDRIAAELVVDCTGRTGRTPVWLEELGYERPAEEQVAVDIKYATRLLRPAPGALGELKMVNISAERERARGVFMCAIEGDRWILTLVGYAGDHAPTDTAGYLDFARTIVPPEVFAGIRDAEPLSDVITSRYPATLRRRYEKLRRFPAGLLALGDAICSFNPVYGQGMTVAALQAEALRRSLHGGQRGIARRFFRAAAKPIDTAWRFTVAADLDLPYVRRDERMPLSLRITNSYLHRLQSEAEHNLELEDRIVKVSSFLDSPLRIFDPRVMCAAVVRPQLRRRRRSTVSEPHEALAQEEA